MKIKFREIAVLFLLVLFSLILPNVSVQAANTLDVVINEIAWMGTQTAYQDEWIELYNNTDSVIKLDGWLLRATDGTPEINLAGTVPANGFYLLERTDDTTVPDITADQTYTGDLGNSGENLELYDNNDPRNLIDAVDSSSGWFTGDNTTKQTMERITPTSSGSAHENWQTSQSPGGTPKSQNSTGQLLEPICEPSEEICDGIDNDCDDLIDEDLGETTCGIGACEITLEGCVGGISQVCAPSVPTEEICDQVDNDCDGQIDEGEVCDVPEPTPEPAAPEGGEPRPENSGREPTTYPLGIFINEFLPSPEGPDAEGEWIEFYNSNAASVDLSEWSIKDTQGRIKSYIFPEDATITGYGFLVLNRPTSKIILNNDGEGLILKNPLGELVNSADYDGKALDGQSYARKTNGTWEWSLAPSPGEENSFPPPEETTPEAEPEARSSSAKASEDKPEPQPESEVESSSVPASAEATADKEATENELQSKSIAYPSGIIINEVLPSPTGPDSEGEWIEIYNQNSFGVDLFGWQIQDTGGRVKIYHFPQGTKIDPQGFLVLSRPTTKITLNNDVDGLNLIQPNGIIVSQVSYSKASAGSSYNRTNSGWAWSNTLTPGSKNIVPAQTSEETGEAKTNGSSKISEKGLAAIGKQIPKPPRSLSVLLIALAVAIFSGAIVFVLKKRIESI